MKRQVEVGGAVSAINGSSACSGGLPSPDVAYVMTHFPRTALTFIAQEIRELERRGGRVTPIAINSPDPEDLDSTEAEHASHRTIYLKAQGSMKLAASLLRTWVRHPAETSTLMWTAVTSARLDLPLAARRLIHVAYACWTWRAVAGSGVRHFHAHFGQTPATVAWFAAQVGTFSSGQPCTWSFTIHGFQDFADERLTRLDLKVASASFVVCVSDFTRAQLCRVTDPAHWDRYHVVRCGIDVDAFSFRAPRRLPDRPRIVTVARLSPEKGHLVLLAAMRTLVEHGVDAELRIIGDGPSAALVDRTAEQLGLEDRVTLTGELQPAEVSRELADADVFCLPSFAEGIPVSIMEAMAVGVPVVTTFVGGIPELAVDGETALVVPAGNSGELATALRSVLTDERLRGRLADAAQRMARQRHDVRHNGRELHGLFAGQSANRSGDVRERRCG
jgi:glycosyltransferase involved in cell wall biosynthesis